MPQAEVQVAVVWNPQNKWQPITVSPEFAFVDPRKNDNLHWTLVSAEGSEAKIESIVFGTGGDGPFGAIEVAPDRKRCVGRSPQKDKKGFFKYTVTVVEGNKSENLDPMVVNGDRP